MQTEQIQKTCLMTAGSVVAAMGVDYLLNAVLMPHPGSYTPIATMVTAALVSAPSWYYVIGQRLALQRTRDRLTRSLAARRAAETASAAKTEFLATMSHELRTPLNAVIGYGEIVHENAVEDGRDGDATDMTRILSSARHLLHMIDEMLDLANIEAGRLEIAATNFEVERLINEVIATIRPAVERNRNALRVALPERLDVAHSDALRLKQCLFNLLSNAAKFTQDGEVALRVRSERRAGAAWLIFEVSDTGIGVPADRLETLFEPFVQADSSITRSYGGTGLGLSITRRLARLLGGDITASSEVGKGSRFILSVPCDRTDDAAAASPVAPNILNVAA